jgi:hypothetical protein
VLLVTSYVVHGRDEVYNYANLKRGRCVAHVASVQPCFPSIFTLHVAPSSLATNTAYDILTSPKLHSMSDKPGIPSWQRTSTDSPVASSPESDQPLTNDTPEQSASPVAEAPTPTEDDVDEAESTVILEQAKRFLDDDAIRDAPREKKVAFLESKGVSAVDIGELLGAELHEEGSVELEEAGERVWSTVRARSSCSISSLYSWMASNQEQSLTFTGFINTRASISATSTTTRNPSNRHLSRVPCTTTHNHPALDDHSVCNRRANGHNLWLVKIHHRSDETRSYRIAA